MQALSSRPDVVSSPEDEGRLNPARFGDAARLR